MAKPGILLINLGTPDNCDPKSVYRYLTEFLNDPRVIDIPVLWRWILVNIIVVPLRHRKTAAAYQKIWQDSGSPLLSYSNEFKAAVAEKLGNNYQVELGMRYGNPSIATAIANLDKCNAVTIVPLFPQYSSAATGSAIQKALQLLSRQRHVPEIRVVRDFFNYPGFINAYTDVIKKELKDKNIDTLLFSYHGLPERQLNKNHCKIECDRFTACPQIKDDSTFCYRAQCHETTSLIANALDLKPEQYITAFQSRLGKTPWIKPYSDLVLPELIQKGVKNIAVVSPSFVADCLETLEEINIRMKEQWHSLGGEGFVYIPCLNNNPAWVEALAELVRNS